MGDKPCIIFVSRNNLALTKAAVRSALSQDVDCPVILIDNASSDGTMAWSNTKPITTIAYAEQKSLAACWNAALKAAWKAGFNCALVCNTDVILRADTVSTLCAHGGEFVTAVAVDLPEQLGEPGDRTMESLYATEREHPVFSCWMIRKSVTDRGLWFDEDCWPAYTEDSRFHVKCHRAGVRCTCVDLPFLHVGEVTLKNSDPGESARIRHGADRNRETFRKMYGCLPGGPGYEDLFRHETFGIDRKRPAA